MDIEELEFRRERDEMFYRERAVDQALVLMKDNVLYEGSMEELLFNANALYNFFIGNLNE